MAHETHPFAEETELVIKHLIMTKKKKKNQNPQGPDGFTSSKQLRKKYSNLSQTLSENRQGNSSQPVL